MSTYAVSSRGLAAHKLPQGTLATIMEMLYSNSEQGIAKLDFSDFTGMYQDRARTVPYTAVGQLLGSFTGINGVTATAPADANRGMVKQDVNGAYYLECDGTNTAYVTPSIDFTGTDKMTVWAGVTKLSDASPAVIVELGTVPAIGGWFYLAGPNSVGPTFGWAARGTVQSTVNDTGQAAPISAVLACSSDIAGDIASLRVNGVTTTSTTDQGAGNYGNYPLYIGFRTGKSLYFNGNLYSLIVRGAATPLPQIEAVENLIRKTMRLP